MNQAARQVVDPRGAARELVRQLRDADGGLLELQGIDLGPALEQAIFTELRAASTPPTARSSRVRRLARAPLAALGALRPSVAPAPADCLVVMIAGVHERLFAPVADVLVRTAPERSIERVTVGRASHDPRLRSVPKVERARVSRASLRSVAEHADSRRFAKASRTWGAGVNADARERVHDSLIRLAVASARIDATLRHVRPRVVAAYDEIDTWGRLLATAARRHGVRSVDLPHAEAVDAEAIRGAAYDVIAVFGSRAAEVMASAGVSGRVVQVGAAGFDAVIRRGSAEVDHPARVVLAGQYLGGRMTEAVSASIAEASLAAAHALAPAILQICPHPVERPARWDRIAADLVVPPEVQVRVESEIGLHALLPGAALLITGWSNSVYEAVLAGVPAITVHVTDGDPPMPFGVEGIASEVRTPAAAGRVALGIARDPGRSLVLDRARRSLEPHLGPLDGRAAERTAKLLIETLAT